MVPKPQVKATEIRSNRPWSGVLLIQIPFYGECDPEDVEPPIQVSALPAQVIDAFCMKITAKALKLTGNKHQVGVIDL